MGLGMKAARAIKKGEVVASTATGDVLYANSPYLLEEDEERDGSPIALQKLDEIDKAGPGVPDRAILT